jgi:hypothetical protein
MSVSTMCSACMHEHKHVKSILCDPRGSSPVHMLTVLKNKVGQIYVKYYLRRLNLRLNIV